MSHISHQDSAHLQLVITATETPGLWRHCPGCKADRAFGCSGKFRVNAQKKLIDVWLIYRCVACDQTWNCPIHERISVRAIAADELNALMQNDRDLARRYASDRAHMMANGARVAPEHSEIWRSHIVNPATVDTCEIAIEVQAASPTSLRLDRLLATGLMLRRADILALAACDALVIGGASLKALKRPALDRQIVRINLTRVPADLADRCRQAAMRRDGT